MLIKDVALDFNKECLSTFVRLKGALILTPVKQAVDCELPFEMLPFEVMFDASDYALRAVFEQSKDNNPYALYYASRTLDET